jgi:tetratricopeptide (TPR) repeat protein
MNRDRKRMSPLGKGTQAAPAAVTAWEACVVIPTYLPATPDKNPMFLEKRVYQGSSGKVYPLPFTDRISEKATPRPWKAVWIENEFLRVMVLPELGGRIHRAIDKTNGYDFIYYQPVIKPALVGLAGPWISGGIEFNWPQHHRPATFLPVDFEIEEHADGSKTVWCCDHDPMTRMRGMHGVCLHPDRSVIELKVRVCNCTPFNQTFLWWANVGARVHEGYQSFFPPDVYYVADHARRSMSEYPLAQGFYYGVNYGKRGRQGVPKSEVPTKFVPPHCGGNAPVDYAPNDLSFYANIPTPCSYMAMGSKEDFFGGYDHKAEAGLIHVADHHIAPGKKQWTWGNHPFGYAWDRNLTDADSEGEFGPYIELMAGVFTDNQPDFSFLAPGETKSWSQFWYPIRKIGPAQHANVNAALSLHLDSRHIRIGVSVSSRFPKAVIRLEREDSRLEWSADLAPGQPFVIETRQAPKRWNPGGSTLRVLARDGSEIIAYSPKPPAQGKVPPPAREPPAPPDIASADELFITGLHLEQYRHATRCPTVYWREALRRDPLDSRCNNALGLWHLRRGEFALAEEHFRKAIKRLTERNANPRDGEPYYNLGLCLRHLGREDEAYDALYKATWNQSWAGPAYHGLAEIDCCRHDWRKADEHLERSSHPQSHNLRAMVAKRQGKRAAAASPNGNSATEPLDLWARHLTGKPVTCDLQTCLDLAHDYARAGFYVEAIQLLNAARHKQRDLPDQSWGAAPLVQYTLGWLHEKIGDDRTALNHYQAAAALPPDYCFPSRLEEIGILESAMRANPRDARAPYYLGNLLYDRRRQEEAMRSWEQSAKRDPGYSVVWRNLGIGYFNIRRQPARARAAYERAFRANPADARLLYERDQLWKRLLETPARRLREFEKHRHLVRQRDDLSVEMCALYNQTGQHRKALELLASRHFQPWEGGEGQALGQHVRTRLALGREALARHDFTCARAHFENALRSPENLGEASHLLANQSDIHYWLGCACEALLEKRQARLHWLAAAGFKGDFQEMSVRAFSEMTYYSALAWEKLGQRARAKKLLRDLLAYARRLAKTPATIDYFATSLPTMLLFDDDLEARQATTALFLEAQARLGLGQRARAKALLQVVLKHDPNHSPAGDLLADCSR